jgi:hypothetical protein
MPFDVEDTNIILDDFICSGRTVDAIYDKILSDNPSYVIDYLIVSSIRYDATIKFTPLNLMTESYSIDKLNINETTNK